MLPPTVTVLHAEAGENAALDDSAVVAELYDVHHDAVRTFARRLAGDAAAAEDLVHDVFLRVPAALRRHRGECTVRTLLLAITVNVARKHVRAAARRRAAMARAGEQAEETGSVRTPEQDVARAQVAAELHRALDALPLAQRVAFVLMEIEERSCAEAARIAGAPEATMRTRLFHAKKRLRELLRKRGIV
ncbi:MAG TPA: sigma-70 family RNA polymerase sigma factor [Polyangiaceae bacterium]